MLPIDYLETSHDPLFVGASLVVAFFASYVTLELCGRVRSAAVKPRRWWLWWAGGSLTLGSGIWAMHFIGMLGFDVGLPLGYRAAPTLLSWIAAVTAAAIALGIASRDRLTGWGMLGGSGSMALAICATHYLGMAALDLAPGIVWRLPWVVASALIAWGASAASLVLQLLLRRTRGKLRILIQLPAAVVMGATIAGMHYSAMAAVQLPLGTICRSVDGLSGYTLAVTVFTVSLMILGGALMLSVRDALARDREAELSRSLKRANLELLEANVTLHRQAFEDPLTGLPNRALLSDRMQHAVARIERQGGAVSGLATERLAVLFVDLDGFKPINDSFGHEVGDDVLRQVAERLKGAVRDSDTLARLGGDEFVALIEAIDAESAAVVLGQRIIDALSRPIRVADLDVSLSCSIGVAVYPDHDHNGQRLLACADAAMYAAKRTGGGTCVTYDPSMSGDTTEQIQLQHALRHAVERGELMLYYQPKVTASDGRVHGFEALLRWQHPERGIISPAVFVPLAERFGIIGSIGNWVIDEACAQLARWDKQVMPCRVAINLSPHQLRSPDLPMRIRNALNRHNVLPAQLVCEITETAMMENIQSERNVLDQIAAMGVCLSIDDFGSGYSSLAHLRNIPARQLKVDRSFVTDLADNADAQAVLDAVMRLAHALHMEVVAEGVETEGQRSVLVRLGCDILQGYMISHPMPAEAVPQWLQALQAYSVAAAK
ncbi:MAG: bifunctional diguanylate cyclase/phosphodiesterase [Hydrogenophaga sp.]|nr:bifunctional diguanylate cyclase/phosphodiesterase [Hydrogenophaga sp.]